MSDQATARPVRWGIVGTVNIALNKLIPAMQASPLCEPWAIGSRNLDKARQYADDLGLPRA